MIFSMTAFARGEQPSMEGTLVCEIRSVNHRYLDLSLRLPEAVRDAEPTLRELLRAGLGRGKVDCTIRLNEEPATEREQMINPDAAARLKGMVDQLETLFGSDLILSPTDLLRWPGILRSEEPDRVELQALASALVQQTLEQFVAARAREGSELKQLILERLADIDATVAAIRQQLPQILESHRTQLRNRIEQLAQEVDEARLEQEMLYLVQKSDVDEELDRLATHVEEVRRVLEEGGVVGRRLDFLMQELNREANTLSSKSLTTDTSLQAVDLKVWIEQMREQIQNIE